MDDYYDDQPDAFGFSPDLSSRNDEENFVTSPKTSRYCEGNGGGRGGLGTVRGWWGG